jgi:hypothetical protein
VAVLKSPKTVLKTLELSAQQEVKRQACWAALEPQNSSWYQSQRAQELADLVCKQLADFYFTS